MWGRALDTDQAAALLFDATLFGDRESARRHRVSVRTLRRYRSELRTSDALASAFRALVAEAEADLGGLRVNFLRKALLEMTKRLERADTSVEAIGECVRIVGEMHATMSMMEADEGSDGSDPEADEAPRNGAGDASVSAAGTH